MTSPLEAYLRDNPQLRSQDRGQLLNELYQTSGVEQDYGEFTQKLLTDPDDPVGTKLLGRGVRKNLEPITPAQEPDLSEPSELKNVIVDPSDLRPPTDLSAKRGNLPVIEPPQHRQLKPEVEQPPILNEKLSRKGAEVLADVLGISDAIKGAKGELTEEQKDRMIFDEALFALGAVGGVPAAAARKAKAPPDEFLMQQKDRLKEIAAYLAPMSGKEWKAQQAQSSAQILQSTKRRIGEMEGEIKAAEQSYDFVRAGEAKAELQNLQEYQQRLSAGLPPGGDDPIMSRVAPHPKGTVSAVTNKWDRFYQGIKDKYHPVNKAVKLATGSYSGSHKLPAEYDPYVLLRLTAGNPGRFEHTMKYGTFNPVTMEVVGPSLRDITKPVMDDLPEAMRYAIAKRVVEKEGQNVPTGMPLDYAKQVVAQVENQAAYDKKYQNIVTFAGQFTKFNRDMVQYLVASGVYSQEQANAFMARNVYYVPAYRLMPELEGGPGRAGASRGVNPIKRMEGSNLEWLDPLESTVQNAYTFIHIAERNRVYQEITRMSEQYGVPEVAQRVKVEPKPPAADSEITGMLSEYGIDQTAAEDLKVMRPNFWRPSPNEITVMRNGQREVWRVDPSIADALSYMDRGSTNMIAKLFAMPAAMLRAGATRSPDFPFANVWRDQFTAVMNTQYGYWPGDIARAIEDVAFNGKEGFKEWLRAGGSGSTLVQLDEMRAEMAKHGVLPMSNADTVKYYASSPLRLLEMWSNMYEYATRLGGYLNARSEGASPQAAAYEARELTVDFARTGAQMRAYNMMVAFQNAQMEGPDRMVRAFASNPTRALTAAVSGNFAPALLLWMANHDDPRYKNLPDWERHSQFIFLMNDWKPVPQEITEVDWQPLPADDVAKERKLYPTRQKEDGTWEVNRGALASYFNSYRIRQKPDKSWEANMGAVVKMPMSWEIGTTFAAAPIAALNKYVADNPQASEGIVSALIQAYTPSMMPTAALPAVEVAADHSFFFDRRITPMALERELPKYRYTTYTSETAKKLAMLLDKIPPLHNTRAVAPIAIEHMVRGWTGSLGDYSLKLSDFALRRAGIADDDLRAAWTGADMPMVRRFIARSPSYAAKPINAFYEKYTEMEQGLASYRKLSSRGQHEQADTLAAEQQYTRIEPYAKALSALRKMVDATQRMPIRKENDPPSLSAMTAEEKSALIQEYYRQMILISNEGTRYMERAGKSSFVMPTRYTAAQNRAKSTGDERFIVFSNLNTADQNILLQHMSPEQRSVFMPYARQGATAKGYDPERARVETGSPPRKGSPEEKQSQQRMKDLMRDILGNTPQAAPVAPPQIDVAPPPALKFDFNDSRYR